MPKIVGFLLIAWMGFLPNLRGEWIEIPIDWKPVRTNDSPFPPMEPKRPRIVLALSGGGARGLAQIGVLQVLERERIPIDAIAGTSIGAVIGGLYALGYSAPEIASIAKQVSWNEIIQDAPPRQELFFPSKSRQSRTLVQIRLRRGKPVFGTAFTGGNRLNALLTALVYGAPSFPSLDFSQLPIPFVAVATDWVTGEKVILDHGSLVDALHASMAIPLLFEPVPIEGRWLVDGGLVENLPVDEARTFGPDLTIAVDTSSKLRKKEELLLPWQLADQVTTILHQPLIEEELAKADIRIQPVPGTFRNTDFAAIDTLIQLGVHATEEALPEIRRHLERLSDPPRDSLWVSALEIEGDEIPVEALHVPGWVKRHEITAFAFRLFDTGAYLDVKVAYDPSTHLLRYHLMPTPFVEAIEIRGNTAFPTEDLVSLFETRPPTWLNRQVAHADCERLLRQYQEAGYTLARLLSSRIEDGTWTLELDEGRIERIVLQGHTKTKDGFIRRDLLLKEGDLFHTGRLNQSLRNLYATGFFENIRFFLERGAHGWILHFDFREKPFSCLSLGLRYDLERQTQGFMEYAEENLAGIGFTWTLSGYTGPWDNRLWIALDTERFLNTLWTFQTLIGVEKRRFRFDRGKQEGGIFIEQALQAEWAVGRQLEKWGTVWIRLGTEKRRAWHEQGAFFPPEEVFLTRLSLQSVVDSRDRLPFPTRGRYSVFAYESGLGFLGGDVSYFRLYSEMRSYHPIMPRWTFSPQIRWGVVDRTAPFVKLFRLGGLDQFLGLPLYGRIGRRFFLANAELRYRIPWIPLLSQYLSIRYDIGGIWEQYHELMRKDLHSAYGLIWSLNTPLGPASLGWGRGRGSDRFYFTIGHAFE